MLLNSPSSNDCTRHFSADTLSRVKIAFLRWNVYFRFMSVHDGSSSSSDEEFPHAFQ